MNGCSHEDGLDEKARLAAQIAMAGGRKKAELLITNCTFVDVFQQRILNGPIALAGGKIIGWGQGYEADAVLDARGGVVLPGLIDAHVHIESSCLTPARFAQCVLPNGTTTVIADPHEIGNVCGVAGLRFMLEAARRIPLNVRLMLPSCVPATPFEESGAVLLARDLEPLLADPGVLGLGEVMDYPGVVNAADAMLDKLVMARRHGRIMDGHSPGLTGRDLTAYIAAGIATDHECGDVPAMQERLSQGQFVLLREGSTCKDLLNLLPGVTAANARRCMLCTDDREPDDIVTTGHINKSLRLAVGAGLEPALAVCMATLSAAECYGLVGKGGIAPGWDADLLIVDNLKQFTPRHVFVGGREVARDGVMLFEPEHYLNDDVLNTVNIALLDDASFRMPVPGGAVRAIGIIPDSVVTKSLTLDVKTDASGCYDARLNPGTAKFAVIERHKATGHIGLGVLSGYPVRNGAIAVSVAHDSHNLGVAGDNDVDMLAAARDVQAMGGGYSICQGGQVLSHLPLPVAGLMSDRPAAEVAAKMGDLIHIARTRLGLPDTFHPLMTLVFMSLPVIPELKLTSKGLFDVTAFRPVKLCVS